MTNEQIMKKYKTQPEQAETKRTRNKIKAGLLPNRIFVKNKKGRLPVVQVKSGDGLRNKMVFKTESTIDVFVGAIE